ncbi:MAG TPA: UTP--glucose-1-phosphate uridylyltransferase [Herpetosiphonaceae bacterium]|nr:UTP--glucose-1-phosphate uridylyltransferase [Herpetosiphonaceae bacterium]
MASPESTFDELVRRWHTGTFTVESNRLHDVAPLEPADVQHLPPTGSPEYEQLEARGRQALEVGEVGAVILAGGMATRFDYDQPKGLFPILEGKSFLQLKIEWLTETAPTMPIFIMTSFHTDEAIRAHLLEHDYFGAGPGQIECFVQNKFPRLTPDGALFAPDDPAEAFAAPGHGDFPLALRRSGLLDRFLQSGGRYLLFSNVDNLGASAEPAIIGRHIESGCDMTIEVATKAPGDKGGAPARVGGRVQLVEGFAFPEDFDHDAIPVFNTASYVFTAEALTRQHDLPWYVVEKKVDGATVIQFEHLAGDLSRTLSVALLAVDRDERFIPVKSQSDVPAAQDLIRQKLERRSAHGSGATQG